MPDDIYRDEAALTASAVDQYEATLRDVARAHGTAYGEFYARLAAAGMHPDAAANVTATYSALVTNDYLTSKNSRP